MKDIKRERDRKGERRGGEREKGDRERNKEKERRHRFWKRELYICECSPAQGK